MVLRTIASIALIVAMAAPLSASAASSPVATPQQSVALQAQIMDRFAELLRAFQSFLSHQSDTTTPQQVAAGGSPSFAGAGRIDNLSNISISGGSIANAHVSGLTGFTTSMLGDFAYATSSSFVHIAAWGDSITAGYGGSPSYPTKLSLSTGYSIYNGGKGGETSTQIAVRMLASDKTTWPSIIWVGRNNYTDPTTVKADIAAMVAALTTSDYIVLSILNGSTEGATTTAYAQITSLNNELASIYGSHYLDIRAYLVSQYDPTQPTDVVNFAADVPPASLRFDFLHPNTAGYRKIADYIQSHSGLLGVTSANPLLTSQNLAQFALTPPSFGFVNSLGGYQQDGTTVLIASSTKFTTFIGLGVGTNSTASWNTAVGYQALYSGTTASANDAFGFQTLYSLTTGSNNSAYGVWSMFNNTTGSSNIAHGGQSLYRTTTGSNNTAIGFATMQTNTTGANNVALGYDANYYNNSATNTVSIGYNAALGNFSNYSAQGSVAVGYEAGKKFATGSDYNTLLGYSAGGNITTGAGNILIGAASTTANSNLTTGYANIVIGNNIRLPSATGSYQLNVGNLIYGTNVDGISNTLSTGSIGIGTTSPWRKFAVTGTVGFEGLTGSIGAGSLCLTSNKEVVYNSGSDNCLSSIRSTKHDINPLTVDALSQLAALQPVSFIYNDDASSTVRYGFIAEDTASVDSHLATYSQAGAISGVDDRALLSVVVKALQNLINQVGDFADRFTTKELTFTRATGDEIDVHKLCLDDVCITKDQLKALLNQSGQQAAPPAQNSDSTPSNNEAATTTISDEPSIAPDASTSSPEQTTQEATTSSN